MNLHLQGFKEANEHLKKGFYRIMMLAFLLAFFGAAAWAQVTPSKVTPHMNNTGGTIIAVNADNGGGGPGTVWGCNGPEITGDLDTGADTVTVNDAAPALTVTSSKATSYQWFFSTNATSISNFKPITNAVQSSFTPAVSTIGTVYYYVSVENTCDTYLSKVATVTVISGEPSPVAGTISGNGSVSTTNSTISKVSDYTSSWPRMIFWVKR